MQFLRSCDGVWRWLPVQESPGALPCKWPTLSPLLEDGINLRLHAFDLTRARASVGRSTDQEEPSKKQEAGDGLDYASTE